MVLSVTGFLSLMCVMVSRVCYERASLSPIIQTFFLSAIWHGVYPGYYLTFLTGVLMTLVARAVSMGDAFSSCRANHVDWGPHCSGRASPDLRWVCLPRVLSEAGRPHPQSVHLRGGHSKVKHGKARCASSEGDGHTRPPDLPPEKPVCRSGSNS